MLCCADDSPTRLATSIAGIVETIVSDSLLQQSDILVCVAFKLDILIGHRDFHFYKRYMLWGRPLTALKLPARKYGVDLGKWRVER